MTALERAEKLILDQCGIDARTDEYAMDPEHPGVFVFHNKNWALPILVAIHLDHPYYGAQFMEISWPPQSHGEPLPIYRAADM